MIKTIPFAIAFFLPILAHASPSIAVFAGSGSDATIKGVTVTPKDNFLDFQWAQKRGLSAHLEFGLSQVDGKGTEAKKNTGVLSATPVFRLNSASGLVYFELGVGVSFFNEKKINATKTMGTHFEFQDLVGTGFRFGRSEAHEVGYRFVHFSNAGISTNNPGLDLHEIRFKFGF